MKESKYYVYSEYGDCQPDINTYGEFKEAVKAAKRAGAHFSKVIQEDTEDITEIVNKVMELVE